MKAKPASALLRSIAVLTGANAASRLMGFLGLALFARATDPTVFGELTTAIAVGAAAYAATEWGLDTVFVRFASRRSAYLRNAYGTFLLLRSATSGLAFIGGIVVCIGSRVPPSIGATVVLAYILSAFAKSIRLPYVAAGQVSVEARISSTERLVVFAMVVLALLVGNPGSTVYSLALLVGSFVAVGLSAHAVRTCEWSGTFAARRARLLLSAATPIGLNALAVWAYYRSSVLILANTSTPAQVGLLGVASIATMGIGIVSQSVVPVLLPRFARIGLRDPASRQAVAVVLEISARLSVVIGAVLALAAPVLLALFFGPSYQDATPVLVVLAIQGMFIALTPVLATVLRANGLQVRMLQAALLGALVTIGSALLLCGSLGAVGAAVSTVLGEATVFVVAAAAACRRIGSGFLAPAVSAAAGLLCAGAVASVAGAQVAGAVALAASIFLALSGTNRQRMRQAWLCLDARPLT